MRLIFATRASALARQQTRWVMKALQKAHPGLDCQVSILTTRGDKIIDKPLPEIGGKGLFTHELEEALLAGEAQCAVHSLKDLPVVEPGELTVGCIPLRADARDTLISQNGHDLESLPSGSVVGTSSLRRAAQLAYLRPDLSIAALRGNVDTRLRKVMDGEYDAIILAGAGLSRLGLESHITQWLPLEAMLPAPGQGALAVQCRADDQDTLSLLAALEDSPTRAAVTAERQYLQGLGGGCAIPVGAFGEFRNDSKDIRLTGLVASKDGRDIIRVSDAGTDPIELGRRLAQYAFSQGAGEILKSSSQV